MGWCKFCLSQMDEQNQIQVVSVGLLMWTVMFSYSIHFKPGSALWFHWTQITSVNYSHSCMSRCWSPILASNAETPENQVENQSVLYPSVSSGPIWPGLRWDTVYSKQHFQFLLPFPNHRFHFFNSHHHWSLTDKVAHSSARELHLAVWLLCTKYTEDHINCRAWNLQDIHSDTKNTSAFLVFTPLISQT